jgi:hypothetical protein
MSDQNRDLPEWLLPLHQTLGQLQATVSGLQKSIDTQGDWLRLYIDRRFKDLKDEVFNRFERTDLAISETDKRTDRPQPGSPMETWVAISHVASALRRLPWRNLLLVTGAVLAFLGHLLPEVINETLRTWLARTP